MDLAADLLTLLEHEVAHCGEDDVREGLLRAALMLLYWDLEEDLERAVEWLPPAPADTPLLVELQRQALLADDSPEGAAELLVAAARKLPGTEEAAQLYDDASLLELYCLGDAARAAQTASGALEAGGVSPAVAARLHHTLDLALALAGDHEERVAVIERHTEAPAAQVLSAAQTAWDRLGEPSRAAVLLGRLPNDPPLGTLLLCYELALVNDDAGAQATLLAREAALLEAEGASDESRRARYLHARRLSRSGDNDGALLQLRQLELAATPEATNLGKQLVLALGRELALAARDRKMLAESYRQLADLAGSVSAEALRARAATLLDGLQSEAGEASPESDEQIDDLLVATTGRPDADATLPGAAAPDGRAALLELRDLRRKRYGPLADHYVQLAAKDDDRRGDLLRRAALLAERADDDSQRCLQLRTESLLRLPGRSGFGDVQRHCRALEDRKRLVEFYRQHGPEADDPLEAALWLAQAAVLQASDDLTGAEATARAALDLQADNLVALAVLAARQRETGRIDELRDTLDELVNAARAPDTRATWLRELASLADNPSDAREQLERAQATNPDDLATMVALAGVYERSESYLEAAQLRERIAARLPDREAQAATYVQLGALYREKLGDDAAAITAYRAALTRRPAQHAALNGLAEIYEQSEEHEQLLEVLATQREQTEDPALKAAIERRCARALEALDRINEAIAAVASALDLEPGSSVSVDALYVLCRRKQRWEALAEVLAAEPPTEQILQLRGEALEQLGRIDELVEVRRDLYQRAPSVPERADRAYDLGRVFEQLGDPKEAADWYRSAVEHVAGHRPTLGALQRIYRDAEDTQSLVAVLEQELGWVEDPRERSDLLLDVATACEELGDTASAARHLEEALRTRPGLTPALDALERLYGADRPLDLARLLLDRARHEPEQASLQLARAADLFAAHDEHEAARQAYRDALFADMSNRETFTACEAYFYDQKLWREVIEIYDALLEQLEKGTVRAYRLADLYSRRGQVQLKHLGQPGEAAASFLKALEQDPKSEAAMRVLTSIFVQQQDWLGLIGTFEFRAGLIPDNELFRLESLRQAARLASTHLGPSAPQTQQLWEEIAGVDPADDEAWAELITVYREGRKLEQLAGALEARVRLETDHALALEMRLELARLCEQDLDDAQRAARAYEAVRALDEHHEEALQALARIYEATGQWEQCVDALTGLVMLEADPDERSLLYFKCGSIAEARFGDDQEAIRLYRRSLEESAGCLPALHGLRDLLLRRGAWQDALDTLEQELAIWDGEREQAGVLARMGQLLLEHLNDEVEATKRYEQALKLDSDCQPALLALFDLNYERDNRNRALQLADRLAPRMAAEGAPQRRSRFYLRRGLLLLENSALPQAADSLVVALELVPDNLTALDALITICRRDVEAYDFGTTFRKLEQVYRSEGNGPAVARVLIAAGTLAELGGDAETALERYAQARAQASTAFEPLDAQTRLLIALRRTEEALTALREFAEQAPDPATRINALLRLGEVYSDALLRPQDAIHVYEEILSIDMRHREGVFRLAQELFALGRPQQARQLVEQLLDPDLHPDLPRLERARYLHYLGVIQLRLGQASAAVGNFRRALQQDHLNAEAALALSQQLARHGDRHAAVELLAHTIHEVSSARTPAAAIELRRALGALFVGRGELEAAISEYEALLREPTAAVEDRIMVAELYTRRAGGMPRAIQELSAVLAESSFDPQALELLANLFDATGERDRAMQVLQVTELLGLARAEDRSKLAQLRSEHPFQPRRTIDERARRLLQQDGPDKTVERLWRQIRPALTRIFPLTISPKRLVALEQAEHVGFVQAVLDSLQLFGSEASIALGQELGVAVLPDDEQGPRLLIDRSLREHCREEVAFAVGRGLGLLNSGHGLVARLAFDDRQLLVELLAGLLRPPAERSDLAEEFLRRLDDEGRQRVDEIAASHQQELMAGRPPQDPLRWLATVQQTAAAHGLLACDDIGAALRMLAILGQQELALGPKGEVAVRSVTDGPELLQYFFSDRYVQLRRRLMAA